MSQRYLVSLLWITDIDPGELEDVLLNMALNAKAAMPNSGTLIISTSNIYLDEYYAHFYANVEPGHFVELTVADTGCGLLKEEQEYARKRAIGSVPWRMA